MPELTTTYSVTIVFEGLDVKDSQFLERLFDLLPDAVPAEVNGVTTIGAEVCSTDPESAAFQLAELVAKAGPEAIPLRLDQDLVAISDIAERTDRSRESIRLLVDGKRGPGGFPPPIGSVGDSIRVWPWAVVVRWFCTALGEDLGERLIDPAAAACVDYLFDTRRQLRRKKAVGQSWTPSRGPAGSSAAFRQEIVLHGHTTPPRSPTKSALPA